MLGLAHAPAGHFALWPPSFSALGGRIGFSGLARSPACRDGLRRSTPSSPACGRALALEGLVSHDFNLDKCLLTQPELPPYIFPPSGRPKGRCLGLGVVDLASRPSCSHPGDTPDDAYVAACFGGWRLRYVMQFGSTRSSVWTLRRPTAATSLRSCNVGMSFTADAVPGLHQASRFPRLRHRGPAPGDSTHGDPAIRKWLGELSVPFHRITLGIVVGLRGAGVGRLRLGIRSRTQAFCRGHDDRVPPLRDDREARISSAGPWALIGTFSSLFSDVHHTPGRSIASVHSFTQSNVGYFFLGFLVVVAVLSFTLLYTRWPLLEAEVQLESMVSREAAFLFNNLLLVGIAFSVLWGTLFPILSEAVRGTKITVGPPFFNGQRPARPVAGALHGIGPLTPGAGLDATFSAISLPAAHGRRTCRGRAVGSGVRDLYAVRRSRWPGSLP